jgi:diguanylate cyclase (GGDEF)-like protein
LFSNGLLSADSQRSPQNLIESNAVAKPITEARMFAALGAANEAILRTEAESELFQRVCDAAVDEGGFRSAGALLPGDDGWLRIAAVSGHDGKTSLSELKISLDPNSDRGHGLAATAFRTGRSCVSNDYQTDPRTLPWRTDGSAEGIGALAAVPILKDDASIGLFLFFLADVDTLNDEIVRFLERMVRNVSFALANFEREKQRKQTAHANRRISDMFAALSAVNSAILQARSPDEMFRQVCESVAKGRRSLGAAAIFLKEPNSPWLRAVASSGEVAERIEKMHLSVDPADPYGQGLHGPAFRDQTLEISYHTAADPRTRQWVDPDSIPHGCAALPLIRNGQSVGVLFFFWGRIAEREDKDINQLMSDIAKNISFGLEMFDREEQKERVSHMFAALSATNEAIMRATNRDELYEMVCQAAVNGAKFTSTTILLVEPESKFFKIAAAAGPNADIVRSLKFSPHGGLPQGDGLAGTAYRSGEPTISNDLATDNFANWDATNPRRSKSAAALPLFSRGRVVGVLLFLAAEKEAFTPDLVELLRRLSQNVSFGLENLDRAEEKASTEAQKERLTRMFAALSATNEAIMRAKSRDELFQLVCEAVVEGAKFTSTTIALSGPDDEFLEIAATTGPMADYIRTLRFSISADRPEGRGLTGTAYRSGRPSVSNDFQADTRTDHWHGRTETRSGAGLPLLIGGKPVGVFLFLSSERGTFTPEFVELLRRLAENVSYALDNFDRVDEKRQADERIQYLATHDGLTGLPNRAMFGQLLNTSIDSARRHGRQFAVLFIDLDRFKVINDSLGHVSGDKLLTEAGDRLRSMLRAGDVVARLGGDEFVVILNEIEEVHQVATVARSLLAALSRPLILSGHECRTTASIGIAIFPEDGIDELTLTKNADMAMYLAKEDGKNDFRFFTKETRTQSVERLTLETQLRKALELDQFKLHYQPKIDVATGRITGVEALLRWFHPELGSLPPMKFIPLAEEIGLIVSIGRWVLQTACAQNMAWQHQGLPPISMAVNLSPRQFSDEHLLRDIDDALVASRMPPNLLQLEITESLVMSNVDRAISLLGAIQSRGIRLAIDDFGTGYSSMSLMKQFPIDTIKIDRSFVRNLPDDCQDKAIAQAIISMGKALGLTVVAEGVETAEQDRFLRDQACDEIQGFLFSKPVPPEAIPSLLLPFASSPSVQPPSPAPRTMVQKTRRQRVP